LEDFEEDAKIILTRITEKQNGLAGTGLFGVGIGTRGGGAVVNTIMSPRIGQMQRTS
jgi:hypothetical protein